MSFDDKVTVMQVRPLYSTVYPFKPNLKLESQHIQTKKDFVRFIKSVATNWKDGDYFLRNSQGTFAYFNLEGNKIRLMRKSKTGREYMCWNFFKPDLEDEKEVKRKGVLSKKKVLKKR